MGVFAAIATIGADQAAAVVGGDAPFGAACQQRIDATLGPERTAWRALAAHGPHQVRDALAVNGIYLFLSHRQED